MPSCKSPHFCDITPFDLLIYGFLVRVADEIVVVSKMEQSVDTFGQLAVLQVVVTHIHCCDEEKRIF